MPEGTKVEEAYQALRREGKSEESAARIAQAQTGLSLATGKPPKHENASYMPTTSSKAYDKGWEDAKSGKAKSCPSDCLDPGKYDQGYREYQDFKKRGIVNSNAYQNGRTKAERHINSRMKMLGLNTFQKFTAEDEKVENIAIYIVEGEEFYGGTVFDAVTSWCRSHGKSTARVSSPSKDAGMYEMTVGGKAVKAKY